MINRLKWIVMLICIMVLSLLPVYKDVSWLYRENQHLQYQIKPFNLLYNITAFLVKKFTPVNQPLKKIDTQAERIISENTKKPTLIILVIGETVRAANWGLNNYKRNTTPFLKNHNVINFSNVTSCGTLTSISVPCIFSPYGQHEYNYRTVSSSESLLHLLAQTGISILWRDNQGGCKGVCRDLKFEHMGELNACHYHNCLDEVLLQNFEDKIPKNNDMLLVLHMNGNHGPAYYQRYPKSFEHWKPACHTSNFSKCSNQEILNAYDNAILYTDSILSELINRLKKIKSHKTGLIYVSDHGESLGENRLYLHGLPFLIAPDYQKQVPMIMWLSKAMYHDLNINKQCLIMKKNQSFSHDYIFSSLLRIFSVKSKVYQAKYDLFDKC